MKNTSGSEEGVGERAQHLLKVLVECYISEGTPVPSKMLAEQPGVDVSSATVRNVMAELEALGLVTSPHTSAGKIPTNLGFRFFVDSLISVQPLDSVSLHQLEVELNPDLSPRELVKSASGLISHITHMAGVVTLPRKDVVCLRQVEFLPLSGDRVLVILVLNEREVQNRVIHTEREYSAEELQQAANFINQEFVGRSLQDIRALTLESMQLDRERMDSIMKTTLDVAAKTFESDEIEDDYVVSGERNLLDADVNTETLKSLFEAFNRKQDILHLLDTCLKSDGIQLFIGEESGYHLFDDYSLVTAPYEMNGEVAGVLGVIGPTRMAYQRVIPLVDITARLLGHAMQRT